MMVGILDLGTAQEIARLGHASDVQVYRFASRIILYHHYLQRRDSDPTDVKRLIYGQFSITQANSRTDVAMQVR